MIYHVVNKADWQAAEKDGEYRAASLASEGFIHTSKKEQVAGVLDRYYKGQTGLLLLHIDESRLRAPLKYEMAPSVNEEFPHIYGPLNTDAVLLAEEL
ncbi:MAG: DUF952 domain-containing protein [Ferruginibacter sp.]